MLKGKFLKTISNYQLVLARVKLLKVTKNYYQLVLLRIKMVLSRVMFFESPCIVIVSFIAVSLLLCISKILKKNTWVNGNIFKK